jgi:hypothetical protein
MLFTKKEVIAKVRELLSTILFEGNKEAALEAVDLIIDIQDAGYPLVPVETPDWNINPQSFKDVRPQSIGDNIDLQRKNEIKC